MFDLLSDRLSQHLEQIVREGNPYLKNIEIKENIIIYYHLVNYIKVCRVGNPYI